MSANILSQLPDLCAPSGVTLNPVVRSYIQDTSNPIALVRSVRIANAQWAAEPRGGAASLLQPQNTYSNRKVKTLSGGYEYIIKLLNKELSGGEDYPILTAALGTVAGIASFGAGLIFTAATTAISTGKQTYGVLARPGDEVWHVEQIGKVGNKAVHVSSYLLGDPYRGNTSCKGWLIHEERKDVVLS